MNYISNINDIPTDQHYVILTNSSITYDDGYGRAGHESYSTTNYISYKYFKDVEEVKRWILDNKDTQYKVLLVNPLKVSLNISIDIDDF